MNFQLNIYTEFFQAVLEGRKKHELRKRQIPNFEVGDVVVLNEIDKRLKRTGRKIKVKITYIFNGGKFDLPDHMCIFSFEPIKNNK